MFHEPTRLCDVHKDTLFSLSLPTDSSYSIHRESDALVTATVQPNYSIWPQQFPLLTVGTSLFPMTLLSGWRCRGAQSVTPYPPDTSSVVCIFTARTVDD